MMLLGLCSISLWPLGLVRKMGLVPRDRLQWPAPCMRRHWSPGSVDRTSASASGLAVARAWGGFRSHRVSLRSSLPGQPNLREQRQRDEHDRQQYLRDQRLQQHGKEQRHPYQICQSDCTGCRDRNLTNSVRVRGICSEKHGQSGPETAGPGAGRYPCRCRAPTEERGGRGCGSPRHAARRRPDSRCRCQDCASARARGICKSAKGHSIQVASR